MNTTRMPGWSAEASVYRSRAHYQVDATLDGLRKETEVLVHPAMSFHCGLNVCCVIFSLGSAICWDRETGERF
jgi:hypothetical protein